MVFLRSYRSLAKTYALSEPEAKKLWRESYWHGISHPVSLMAFALALLAGPLFFAGGNSATSYILMKNTCIGMAFVAGIVIVNFFQTRYVKEKMRK